MKKALLVVSFGTMHLDTLEKNIAQVEKSLAEAFPERTLFRAFTSGIVRKRLRDIGVGVMDVSEALETLHSEGYEDILIQSTHVICGLEWEKVRAQIEKFRFPLCRVGLPLLSKAEDYPAMARAVLCDLPKRQEETAIVLMGHGTEHAADASYNTLQERFSEMGRSDVYIATVEGGVQLESVMASLKAQSQIQKIICKPLMLVAGDHAKNDMAGSEGDSWKSQLEKLGYEVSCILEGLGEKESIRRLYVEHAANAKEYTCESLNP